MSNLKRAAAIAAGMAMISSGVALAEPLSAGKPAGVKKAQMELVPVMAWIALAGIAGAGIAAAASSGSGQSTFTTVPASTA